MRYLLALLVFLYNTSVAAPILVDDVFAQPDCGAGKANTDGCDYTPTGNCDGTQGTAVAMSLSYHVPENSGRFVSFAATSSGIEFDPLDGTATPITFPTRYRQFQIGTPPNKVNVGDAAINEFVLETLPTSGGIYSGATLVGAADYTFYDPDKLFYKPNAEFVGTDSFTYCAIDSTGRTNIATISITVADPATYPMPLGFSDPGFGINKTPPADPGGWPGTEVSNFYYIDSDDGSCSDSNTYGYPNVPRCSLPANLTTVAAGGKIVLAASSTPYELRAGSTWHQLDLDGSSGSEVWIVGDSDDAVKPIITFNSGQTTGTLRLLGSHFIIDGVDLNGVSIDHRDELDTHLAIRNSIVRNKIETVGTPLPLENDNILVFNSSIYDNGLIENDLSSENDVHGINMVDGNGLYVLDVQSYGNGGDTIQLTNNNTTENVNIGRIVCHSDMENCVDIKDFNKVVVTESVAYDYRQVNYGLGGGGQAQAFYVNDEGTQQNYVYFMNNRCWDSTGDTTSAASCYGLSNVAGRTYLIGNEVAWNPQGAGFYSGTGSAEMHATLNTFANTYNAINVYNSASGQAVIVGNYIYNASNSDMRIVGGDYDAFTLVDYNFTDANPGTYLYGSNSSPSTAASLADFKTQISGCTNCDENQAATFNNASIYDFSITAGDVVDSVLATIFGSGTGQDSVFVDLNADLGISSYTDRNGTVRPQNINYDAGAYEDAP